MFTPILKDLYNDLNNDGAKKMEVVFVSSDDDEAAMRAYMKEAHADWLTGMWITVAAVRKLKAHVAPPLHYPS